MEGMFNIKYNKIRMFHRKESCIDVCSKVNFPDIWHQPVWWEKEGRASQYKLDDWKSLTQWNHVSARTSDCTGDTTEILKIIWSGNQPTCVFSSNPQSIYLFFNFMGWIELIRTAATAESECQNENCVGNEIVLTLKPALSIRKVLAV